MQLDSQSLRRLRDRVALFVDFTDAELVTLLRRGERLNFEDGERVFREGTPGDRMFVIVAGHVRITRRMGLDDPEDIAVLDPGDCFGEMGLIDTAPRSADATAEGPATVLALSAKALARADSALSTRLMRNFASILAARLRAANEQIARLTAREREVSARFKQLTGRVAATETGLRGVELNHADLEGASLRGADLRGTLLHDARLPKADFREADLRGADLRGADLSGANLSDADLRCADLRGARLSAVDLSRAQMAGALSEHFGDREDDDDA
ncbi:MAG: pentapeptide repeat-containing protein [Myxococcales bacterium]|nr:pentapeptide repeat-containing protein [Myxococcales bacterium]